MHPALVLQNKMSFSDLFSAAGLQQLDEEFLHYLAEKNPLLLQDLQRYRQDKNAFTALELSEFLIACAPFVEAFIAELFNVTDALAISHIKTTSQNPVAIFKKYYVLRRAKKEINRTQTMPSFKELNEWLSNELQQTALTTDDPEMAIALLGNEFLADPEKNKNKIEKLVQWCTQALVTTEGQAKVAGWTSFRIPQRLDYQNLVKTVEKDSGRLTAPANEFRLRDGFELTDPRMDAREVQDEIHYCVYCHDHDGDFCSKGFPVKKGDPEQGFKKNPLGVTLTGCPLEEKISEMQVLKRDGHTVAALAVVMIDNPMCPATGHRICNECMKSCIYQKQEPVNIPQIETRVLTDVLALPWGVEIYDLLTRWNPLRSTQYVMKPYNGLKVLIAGMGPAGFTLAHHLLQEGFAVVGFDGLKIEPLSSELIKNPIYNFSDLKESLAERLMAGFGGVAEYGITVRWDKNFLKLIYLSLVRRPTFQVFGSIRFGGTITVEDAWQLGFDHFAVAVGAGLPKALAIENSLAPGMRQANDFLMSLQLGNAAKKSSLTNLQIRLPAVVIGGGLTGVDTATELQAYYIAQVEKLYHRYHRLVEQYGEAHVFDTLSKQEREILTEYLHHGREIADERAQAKAAKRVPNFIKLIHEWGGVTITYRRSMRESPAYINNHEELQKALQEGIFYIEGLEPKQVILDEYGHCETLVCHQRLRDENNEWQSSTQEVNLSARSILVATGTQPNIAYEFEHKGTFNRLNLQYQHYEDDEGELYVAHGVEHCKDPAFGPFTSYQRHHQRVSLIGDTHPVFHGSVVKAIASGYRTYPKILEVLKDKLNTQASMDEYEKFAQRMQHLFNAKVQSLTRQANDVLKMVVIAPLAAKHFKPGQFYRLQNFETNAKHVDNSLLQMEPLALVAADCDQQQGTLTFYIIEDSPTAKLCATLQAGDFVSLMGPTGVRAKIPTEHETVLILGDRASLPFLSSYGKAVRAAGNRVLYFGIGDCAQDFYDHKNFENAADTSIWINSDNFVSDVVNYTQDELIQNKIALSDVDRVFVVGNVNLLKQFQTARQSVLKDHLIKNPKVFGSVYGNMQCMLKGVCAQCLQWQIDPETGQRTKAVFACSWQDQPLEIIDIDHIHARNQQNNLLEQISKLWIDHLFTVHSIKRV